MSEDEEIGKRPCIQEIDINAVGNAVVEILGKAVRGSVSIYMVAVDDETGKVAVASSYPPEQVSELLQWILRQHRAGQYSFEASVPGANSKH